jgi:hypothetical protein
MDPDPGPAIFVIDLQEAKKKLFRFLFFCLLVFEGIFTLFSKINSIQKFRSYKTEWNQGFSLPLTDGSVSGSRTFCIVKNFNLVLCLLFIGEIAIGNKVLKRLEESLTADYTSHALVADILYSQVKKSDFNVQNFEFLNF